MLCLKCYAVHSIGDVKGDISFCLLFLILLPDASPFLPLYLYLYPLILVQRATGPKDTGWGLLIKKSMLWALWYNTHTKHPAVKKNNVTAWEAWCLHQFQQHNLNMSVCVVHRDKRLQNWFIWYVWDYFLFKWFSFICLWNTLFYCFLLHDSWAILLLP